MDQKAWVWGKRSSEKTIFANGKSDLTLRGNDEKMIPTEKEADLERAVKELNLKLASVLHENNTKDEIIEKHSKIAEEAIAGREKAEAEAKVLKQELEKALKQEVASNGRLIQLNAALKESMQQLSLVREGKERGIHEAVMKTSTEFEKVQKKLEEKLAEQNKRLSSLTVENNHLVKVLIMKETVIVDLTKRNSQAEVEFSTLMARLDSVEKENTFLSYELRMLEKELEIRNGELEFNRQSANKSHKHHVESAKKISKLEAECQRLRILMRKRLPGPGTSAKMKSEVEILGKNQTEVRRRSSPGTGCLVPRDGNVNLSPGSTSREINCLIERLCEMEEENKVLREILAKKDHELHTSRTVCAQTTSKLSKVEAQLGELSQVQASMELVKHSPALKELSPTSSFGFGSDEIDSSESWASALMSELEHFRNGKSKTQPESMRISDLSLMDDFVEMEKLAIVAVDNPLSTSYTSSDASNLVAISLVKSGGNHLEPTSKELVPVVQEQSSDVDGNNQMRDVSTGKSYDWLQEVLKMIFDQSNISKRSLDEVLEDIRMGLNYMNHKANRPDMLKHPEASDLMPISGYITWKSPNASPRMGTLNCAAYSNISVEEPSKPHFQASPGGPINKIIELLGAISPTCSTDDKRVAVTSPCKSSTTASEYLIRVFRWKSSELTTILRNLVCACEDVLDGKANFETFAGELTSALEWIMKNCIPFEDVSCVRDKINKHLGGWDKSKAASELGAEGNGSTSETDKVHLSNEHSSCVSFVPSSSSCEDLEARLKSANDKNEDLMEQLKGSDECIRNLQSELKELKESKGMVEDQIENQKTINEELDTQLTVVKVKLNEVLQKLSSLEVEFEDKSHCCEELEATCLELQLQLESFSNKQIRNDSTDQDVKLVQTGWEITAASAKLAECQETILNLGNHLKALTSPRETTNLDKAIVLAGSKKLTHRSSLRDRMLAEDDEDKAESPKTKQVVSTTEVNKSLLGIMPPLPAESLAIIPSKKRGGGGGFLRKLLLRRKTGSGRRAPHHSPRKFLA